MCFLVLHSEVNIQDYQYLIISITIFGQAYKFQLITI